MAKYKVGDRVRTLNFKRSGGDDAKIGATGHIVQVKGEDRYNMKFDNNTWPDYAVTDSEIELVKTSKGGKIIKKKVNFLLKYDLDTDPVEEFETLKEVKARIADLVKNEKTNRLKRDSIVVYEIRKVTKVKIETSVSIKGL